MHIRLTDHFGRALLLLLSIFLLISCGSSPKSLPPSGGGGTIPSGSGGGTIPGGGGGGQAPTVGTVTVTANPLSLTVGGNSSLTATVLDTNGANMPDGTTVQFSLNDQTLGIVTGQATTYLGQATGLFTAQKPGTAVVAATAGSVSGTVTIPISAPATGSIEFTSASPQVIGIQGTGQTETSVVTFDVLDINGNPVVDGIPVDFSMVGPSGGRLPGDGGEYIGDLDNTPTQASGATAGGKAVVILHSGKVAGPVVITASVTVSGVTMSSSSTAVSIGGGVPSDTHFTLATSIYNLPGFGYVGRPTDISVYLADRFGNYNVLTGTTVSFYAEAGAIDRSGVTDDTGLTTVVWRTQNPPPADTDPIDWENVLCQYIQNTYGPTNPGLSVYDGTAMRCSSGHPRNGFATITASVKGEESFIDADGNGSYDQGEHFTDTPQEAFVDANDDGAWNDGPNWPGPDPRELFIDDNMNGSYDGANGVWDANKTIFRNIQLLFTGGPYYELLDQACPFGIILPGQYLNFNLLVADYNLNPLTAGTQITISSDGGTLSGSKSLKLPDMAAGSYPTEMNFSLGSSAKLGCDLPGATSPCTAKPATITIDVKWEGVEYISLCSGLVYQ